MNNRACYTRTFLAQAHICVERILRFCSCAMDTSSKSLCDEAKASHDEFMKNAGDAIAKAFEEPAVSKP